MDQSLCFALTGVLHDLAGSAEEMPCISDEIVTGVHHVLVSSDDGKALGNTLILPRIVSAIKTLWHFDGTDSRVIGQHQRQAHLWAALFYFLDRLRRHAVEATVVTHKKIPHTVFRCMALDFGQERRIDFGIGVTMADKKARLIYFIIPAFLM